MDDADSTLKRWSDDAEKKKKENPNYDARGKRLDERASEDSLHDEATGNLKAHLDRLTDQELSERHEAAKSGGGAYNEKQLDLMEKQRKNSNRFKGFTMHPPEEEKE